MLFRSLIGLICADPYLAFAKIVNEFYEINKFDYSSKNSIHQTAKIGKNSQIASNSYIGKNVIDLTSDKFKSIEYTLDLSVILDTIDLVFTTTGSTVWELLAKKIPFGVAVAVNNQLNNYNYLIVNNLAMDIGFLNSENVWIFNSENITSLIINPETRSMMVENQLKLQIGEGANLIVDKILEFLN